MSFKNGIFWAIYCVNNSKEIGIEKCETTRIRIEIKRAFLRIIITSNDTSTWTLKYKLFISDIPILCEINEMNTHY